MSSNRPEIGPTWFPVRISGWGRVDAFDFRERQRHRAEREREKERRAEVAAEVGHGALVSPGAG